MINNKMLENKTLNNGMVNDKYGDLFHDEKYGKDAGLLRGALLEIAEHIGHTWENPVSISLLCT
jgi:hypothetical protein